MIRKYPSGEETFERGRVSLFFTSWIDEDFNFVDIISQKPWGYWIRDGCKTIYFGPNEEDESYEDYFYDNSLASMLSDPYEITFKDFKSLSDYWETYHPSIRPPEELVALFGLEQVINFK